MSSDSEDEEEFSTKPLQRLLESMYDELTDAAIGAKKIYYAAKEPQDYFTHPFKLKKEVRDILGVRRISVDGLLKLWIPRWKEEGRLNRNGSVVRVGDEEARLLGFHPQEEVDVYDLCARVWTLFDEYPN